MQSPSNPIWSVIQKLIPGGRKPIIPEGLTEHGILTSRADYLASLAAYWQDHANEQTDRLDRLQRAVSAFAQHTDDQTVDDMESFGLKDLVVDWPNKGNDPKRWVTRSIW